jgi:hypothetical protein
MREPDSRADPDPIATLLRWEGGGAVWRVLGRTRGEVTVGLFSCDGGEEMGRLRSSDPRVLGWVEEHENAGRQF